MGNRDQCRRISDVVVVGAGYAGLRCALRLAWRMPELRMTVVDPRDYFAQKIRFHQVASGQRVERIDLRPMLKSAGIRFVHAAADTIDFARRTVGCGSIEIPYDRLVWAVGSVPQVSVDGASEYSYAVAEEAGAHAIADRLLHLRVGSTVTVVGGGLTGIETAVELGAQWPQLRLELVCQDLVGETIGGREVQESLRRRIQAAGVGLTESTQVHSIHRDYLETSAGRMTFDLCIWASGFCASPQTGALGLPVTADGRLSVDHTLRCCEHPEIYGIGDAALAPSLVGVPMLMSCRLASPMGALAADNIAREAADKPVRSFKPFDTGRALSLGRDDAMVLVPVSRRMRAVATRAVGAWIKEQVCKYTLATLRAEQTRAVRARRISRAALPEVLVDGTSRPL